MIKKLSIYYLLFILAFSWGLLVGYKKIFPYKILRSIAQETLDFYKGEKNIKDISIVDKFKNDLGFFPSRHLVEYSFKDDDYINIELENLSSRRGSNPKLKIFFDKKDENYFDNSYLLVQGFFDFNDSLYGAILLDFNGNVINTWRHNHYEFKDKENSIEANLSSHPIVMLNDGSIIYTIHGQRYGHRIIRSSYCGDIIWTKKASYHHSLSLDRNQNIWTIDEENSFVLLDKDNGSILKEIFLKNIFEKNKDLGIFNFHINLPGSDFMTNDPFHINDVEPLNSEIESFEIDDLLVSFRNSNLIFILDKDNRVKWWRAGATRRQHDPDWGENYITIFDNGMRNNSAAAEKELMSRIIKIDLETLKSNVIFDGEMSSAYSVVKANHQILDNDYILATISMQGRVLVLDKNQNLKVEFINNYNKSFNGQIGEAAFIKNSYLNFDSKNEKCN